jgi:hypothetical protein
MHKTLVATYDTLESAETVVAQLVQNGFQRQDIGLAVDEDATTRDVRSAEAGPALVTVTAEHDRLATARRIMEHHHPQELDEREMQWRKSGDDDATPDEDEFTAIRRMTHPNTAS